ncbi:hypothetical protein [Aliivibrio fischeri]|uniref:hypothetical protein n=1 Tax=Aliivibrio fischeri TaxID=668 RepID=UPI00080DF114|nr:hypothetical protein [Aliivibrio fischeri]OCH07853.1 hypothetical protein A6E11_01355 [Aliivibrio fischeri]
MIDIDGLMEERKKEVIAEIKAVLKLSEKSGEKLELILSRFEEEGKVWFDRTKNEWKEVDKNNLH